MRMREQSQRGLRAVKALEYSQYITPGSEAFSSVSVSVSNVMDVSLSVRRRRIYPDRERSHTLYRHQHIHAHTRTSTRKHDSGTARCQREL
jgi:hypothetical protein